MKGRSEGPPPPLPPHFKDKYIEKVCDLFTALLQTIPDTAKITSILDEEITSADVDIFFNQLIDALSDNAITDEHRNIISTVFVTLINKKCDIVQLSSCIMKECKWTNDSEINEKNYKELADKVCCYSEEGIAHFYLDYFKEALGLRNIERKHFEILLFTIYAFSLKDATLSKLQETDLNYISAHAEASIALEHDANRNCINNSENDSLN